MSSAPPRSAAGARLHLGLMGTLSFRPAAASCKQLLLPPSPYFPSLIVPSCRSFSLPSFYPSVSPVLVHLNITSLCPSALNSPSPRFNLAFLPRTPLTRFAAKQLSTKPWRQLVSALAVVSQQRVFPTFVKMLKLLGVGAK